MNPLPNTWLGNIATFDEVLTHLELTLSVMKENSKSADFSDDQIRQQYSNDVIFTKQIFERAEYLARNV